MDNMWRDSVLIEKAGNQTISQFNLPEDWAQPLLKSRDTNFEDIDNPGKWYQYYYH